MSLLQLIAQLKSLAILPNPSSLPKVIDLVYLGCATNVSIETVKKCGQNAAHHGAGGAATVS